MARWCFVLLLILLLNAVLPFSSASQNFSLASQNVTEATTEGDGNIRDHIMDNIYKYVSSIPILRILKTVGVALGVALATIFIAPIIVYFLLCCFGFTCSGNNEIIAVSYPLFVFNVIIVEGVRGGSYAANRQSYHGNVKAGSHFSRAQSMGASSNMGRNCCIGLIFGIPAGAIAGYYDWFYFENV